jgi:cell division protein ZapA
MQDEDFKIRLELANNKYYPYRCKRSEEGIVRKAATKLRNKFLDYNSYYSRANFDASDILTLVGFHFSCELLKNETSGSLLFDKIEQLNKELEEYIKSL